MRVTTNEIFCVIFLYLISLATWIGQPAFAQDAKKEILIGSHLPLTGAMAMQSVEQKWAYEKAVEDINKKGGIYVKEYNKKLPVRLIIMDDETDPVKAAALVKQMITQTKVDLLLSGCTAVFGVLPGLITAEKYHKYYHATTIWIPDFLKHNFKWGTMFFMDIVKDAAIIFKIWNSVPKNQRPQKVAIFVEESFDGKQTGDLWASLAEKYGSKIVIREPIEIGAKDFTAQIVKAKSMNVDAILSFFNMEEALTCVRQMKKIDFSVKYFMGIKGTWPQEFYKGLGKDANYVLCDGFWSMDIPFPGAKRLGESFHKEFGKYSVGVGLYYALCQILWQAVEKAGTLDSEKVRKTVINNKFTTVMGEVDYDEKGVAVFPLTVQQWWNGKQHIVYPFEYSNYKIKIAPTWKKR